jgi:hypothetical protein
MSNCDLDGEHRPHLAAYKLSVLQMRDAAR